MTHMVNLQVRISESLRDDAVQVLQNMGLDATTAIRMFFSQIVRDNGMPFRPDADPFYSPANIRHLERVYKESLENRNLVKHDLIEDEE